MRARRKEIDFARAEIRARTETNRTGEEGAAFAAPSTKSQKNLGDLGGLFEGAFDESEAALGLFAQKVLPFAAFAQAGVQFVGDGQSGEHRGFLRVHGGSGVGDGAHFFIHVGGKFLDVGGIEIARNRIGLAEDLNPGR